MEGVELVLQRWFAILPEEDWAMDLVGCSLARFYLETERNEVITKDLQDTVASQTLGEMIRADVRFVRLEYIDQVAGPGRWRFRSLEENEPDAAVHNARPLLESVHRNSNARPIVPLRIPVSGLTAELMCSKSLSMMILKAGNLFS